MKTLLYGGKVLCADGSFLESCPVMWENDRILAVGEDCNAYTADEGLDATGKTVLPGLLDVHTHGRAGYDFATADQAGLDTMRRDYLRHGVTGVFATLASATVDEWLCAIERIQASDFEGIHFEGRYLNPAKRGAHAPELIVPLDADELDRLLCKVTLPCHISAAYELDTDGSFASCAKLHGATMGLGHTAATASEARAALACGVISFTHLYNAMPPLHHREGGAVSVALCGGGYGELIVDGVHVCPEMVALAWRCLGKDKTVLITDSMEGTGCADGTYSIAGQPVILKNGKALTLDGALAGSTLELWDGVKNLMAFTGATLAEAVGCATRNPARMVGMDGLLGSIEAGKRADLLLVDENTMEICNVIAGGCRIR